MFKSVTFIIFIAHAAYSDSFYFPDQVSARANSDVRYGGHGGRGNVNSYGNGYIAPGNQGLNYGSNRQQPGFNGHYDGYQGGFGPEYGNNGQQEYPYNGQFLSQSDANAQSTNFGSQSNAQSGSQYFNGGSQSNAQAQAQSHGYSAPTYPFRPSGGRNGASSASSASSAASGNGDGAGSASAAAAAASSSFGSSSSTSSASSASSSRYNGGFLGNQGPASPWFFNSRIAGENGDSDAGKINATAVATSTSQVDDKLIFAE